ncbi:diguanylate cyclase [Sphingosinicella sp. BN140058]|uniref:sensor domain-containing diguanylate cyclase n=1 Tax=Sphingosinicella sp. BN140058 TaxID=1892855 RepID=UPI001011C108|nr:diguanylate cyclase [Sphingosinicella sp. BN140058]QAY77159.1 diguanylate cyclase [Sphingosinicella sp. BN140058]
MPKSLGVRIAVLGVSIVLTLAAVGALLTRAGSRTEQSIVWVAHTQDVLRHIAEPVDRVRKAESDLRGMILSRDRSFVDGLDASLERAERDLDALVRLTRDNPEQNIRARGLRRAMLERIAYLRGGLSANQTALAAEEMRRRAHESRLLMTEVDRRREEMLEAEQALLASRMQEAANLLSWNKHLVLLGGGVVAGVVLLMILIVARGVRRPTGRMLAAMHDLGAGATATRIDVSAMGSREFSALAGGYNAMAERLEQAMERQRHSDDELQTINGQLQARSEALHARSEVIASLSAMAHRMQAARTDDEFADVIGCFVPAVLPELSGGVYAHNNSRNQLVRIARWGDGDSLPSSFAPHECWALRLGQGHTLSGGGADIVCAHVRGEEVAYHCEPLLAGGEVIGSIHLRGAISPESRFRLDALAENIASALVNYRLQRDLREQTIRDPLTNLFNRRYLEETLAVEIARATRADSALTVVMCDVDHFKRFNDEHGHDAGDHVLQAVAEEMRQHFRDGDVVCRYGGEEFTIIAPGASPEVLTPRIERLRLAIGHLQLRHAQQTLGAVSMSFGLASWQKQMGQDGEALLQTADEALYRAKRAGRNRSVIAQQLAA